MTEPTTEWDDDDRLPPRPRRKLLTPPSAVVLALATCAVGFYAGVRVEKGHASPSATGSLTTRAAATGSGFAARFSGGTPGGFGGPGGGSAGTVVSVDGHTLVLKETSGDTVKVKLNSATKVTKSKSVSHQQIRPGDSITVSGVTSKQGTISASSVSDSGASSFGTSSAGTSGASASAGAGSSGSALGSLFSSR